MAETTNDQKFAATLARLDTRKKTMDEARAAALPSERQKDEAFFSEARARSGPYNQRGGGGTSDRADKATLTARLRSYSDPNSPLRQVLAGLEEEKTKAAAAAALGGATKPTPPAETATPPVGTPAIKSEDSGVRKNLNIETPSYLMSDTLANFTPFNSSATGNLAGTNAPGGTPTPVIAGGNKTTATSAPVEDVLPVPFPKGGRGSITAGTPAANPLPNTGTPQASFFNKPMTDEEKAKQGALNRVTAKV